MVRLGASAAHVYAFYRAPSMAGNTGTPEKEEWFRHEVSGPEIAGAVKDAELEVVFTVYAMQFIARTRHQVPIAEKLYSPTVTHSTAQHSTAKRLAHIGAPVAWVCPFHSESFVINVPLIVASFFVHSEIPVKRRASIAATLTPSST